MQSLSKHNGNYNWLLTVIDCFSKYAWAIPTKNKSGPEITNAFSKILKKRKPIRLQTDAGKEFVNSTFLDLMKKEDIIFFTAQNDVKCAIVERFNRTLKTKMWRFFTHKATHRYIEVLPKLMKSYNSSYHTSIKMPPETVDNSNQYQVYCNLYGQAERNKLKFKYEIGDNVRISKAKMVFEKGYVPSWTEEIFIVSQRLSRDRPVYKLKDLEGEEITSVFYEPELQKVSVTQNKAYKIEQIIKTKGKGSNKQYFVKWWGYPEKFNSWISQSDIAS
jgi:hypothetical protein